jgi:hypothetical protein
MPTARRVSPPGGAPASGGLPNMKGKQYERSPNNLPGVRLVNECNGAPRPSLHDALQTFNAPGKQAQEG